MLPLSSHRLAIYVLYVLMTVNCEILQLYVVLKF